MKNLSVALLLSALALPVTSPLQAAAQHATAGAIAGQDTAVERRAKRCPSGETPTTNPACRGHGGGGI